MVAQRWRWDSPSGTFFFLSVCDTVSERTMKFAHTHAREICIQRAHVRAIKLYSQRDKSSGNVFSAEGKQKGEGGAIWPQDDPDFFLLLFESCHLHLSGW